MTEPIYANLSHCPHCTMRFVSADGIEAHIAERHPKAVAPPGPVYVPPHVPGTKYPTELQGNFVDALACPHCSAVLRSKQGLSAHIRIKHAAKPEAPPAA